MNIPYSMSVFIKDVTTYFEVPKESNRYLLLKAVHVALFRPGAQIPFALQAEVEILFPSASSKSVSSGDKTIRAALPSLNTAEKPSRNGL